MSIAAAKGVSTNDAVVAVFSQIEGISAIKENQKTTLMALLLIGFDKNLVKGCGT